MTQPLKPAPALCGDAWRLAPPRSSRVLLCRLFGLTLKVATSFAVVVWVLMPTGGARCRCSLCGGRCSTRCSGYSSTPPSRRPPRATCARTTTMRAKRTMPSRSAPVSSDSDIILTLCTTRSAFANCVLLWSRELQCLAVRQSQTLSSETTCLRESRLGLRCCFWRGRWRRWGLLRGSRTEASAKPRRPRFARSVQLRLRSARTAVDSMLWSMAVLS